MRTRRHTRTRLEDAPVAAMQALHDSWEELAATLPVDAVCEVVLARSIAALGASGGCMLLATGDGSGLELACQVGLSPRVRQRLHWVALTRELPVAEAGRTGEPVLLGSRHERDILFPELGDIAGEAVVTAAAPMLDADGQLLGVLDLAFEDERTWDQVARELLVGLARHGAQAIERSRLVGDLQGALDRERAARADLTFAAEAGAALGESLDLEAVVSRLASLVVPHLADWCSIDLLVGADPDQDDVVNDPWRMDPSRVRHHVRHGAGPSTSARAAELRERWGAAVVAAAPAMTAIRHGSSSLLERIDEDLLRRWFPDERDQAMALELGMSSLVAVPLVAHGRTIAVLTLVSGAERPAFGPRELALARTLADRAAAAIDNARMYATVSARARASQVLEHIGDGVLLVDPAGRIALWNRAAETITGLAADEVIGRTATEAIPGWQSIADRVPVTLLPHSGSVTFETLPLGPDVHLTAATDLWVSISGVQFPDGIVYAFRDVSDIRAVERMKSDFVATVSHELRTPLASVYGAAMTLRRTDLDIGEAARGQLLDIIASESDRLGHIINDILMASHLDSGRIHLERGTFDVRELIVGVVASAATRTPPGVDVELLDAGGRDLDVVGDRDRVRQVLVNLVENAIKYSPDGGAITVSVAPDSDGCAAAIAVRDHGMGIAPREQRRVFEKFFRSPAGGSRGISGTGLGLYICRELVTRMGGHIRLESKLGDGSTFHLELPLARA